MADQAAFIRLAMALTLSAFLHLVLIFWPGFHLFQFDRSETGTQIVLRATILATPNFNTPQSAKTPLRTQKTADRARRAGSAEARSTSGQPPNNGTSVELSKSASSEPENAKSSTERESASETKSDPAAEGQPPEEKPLERSPGPEQREVTSIQDADTPAYPAEAIRRGLESCVLAAVYVSPSGEVQTVRILHADVPEVFDQSVIDAHSAARYLPARQHGENLPSRVLAVVTFVLEPDHVRNCPFKYAEAARRINALAVSAELGPAIVEEALRATQ